MILTVRNDQGQEFEHHCDQFVGYDVYVEACDLWGNNWHTYTVISLDQILEKVLNPNTLDPTTAERIH